MSRGYRKPTLSKRAIAWEFEYDDESNFAHMGVRYVLDGFGCLPAPRKATAKRREAVAKLKIAA